MKVRDIAFLMASIVPVSVSAGMVPVSQCYYKAGKDYGIDPVLLIAIGIKESRLNNKAINRTTYDYCQMQVNSSHSRELAKFGIKPTNLTNNPCECIYTGAWVLAKFFKQYGASWNTVGMYNAGARRTPRLDKIRKEYSDEVKSIYYVLKHQK